jgi:hypothetical protein
MRLRGPDPIAIGSLAEIGGRDVAVVRCESLRLHVAGYDIRPMRRRKPSPGK